MALNKNYWIFQSVPDRFDLREKRNLQNDKRDHWDATRYRSKMNTGDFVYFWMGGPREIRGIYGWGKITSKPYTRADGRPVVDVLIEQRLDQFVSVDKVRRLPSAENLMILNIAIGTNFYINHREAREIASLIAPKEKPEIP